MKPAPPPTPRPPPSDFCSNTVAIKVATIIRWTTMMTVCISTFRRKPIAPMSGCSGVFAGFEVARCYTIGWGVVTPVPPAPKLGTTTRNRKEIGRFQAGAANQRTVHIGHRQQFPGIRRFYGAPVQDPDPGALTLKPCNERNSNKPMNLLNISDRGCQAGTDCPDRLVGHHQIVRPRAIGEGHVELAAADVEGLALVALVLRFADADDRGEAGAPDRF